PLLALARSALSVFQESVEYWGRLQSDGQIEDLQLVFLAPHGGDLNGVALLRGGAGKVDEVQRSDEFDRSVTRAGLIVESLGVVPGVTGDDLAVQVSLLEGQLDELT